MRFLFPESEKLSIFMHTWGMYSYYGVSRQIHIGCKGFVTVTSAHLINTGQRAGCFTISAAHRYRAFTLLKVNSGPPLVRPIPLTGVF